MARKHSTWNIREARELIRETAMKALHDGAEAILTESLKEVPVATGTLARSATVNDAPDEDAVYISYNTPYAVRQHEDLTLRRASWTVLGPKPSFA